MKTIQRNEMEDDGWCQRYRLPIQTETDTCFGRCSRQSVPIYSLFFSSFLSFYNSILTDCLSIYRPVLHMDAVPNDLHLIPQIISLRYLRWTNTTRFVIAYSHWNEHVENEKTTNTVYSILMAILCGSGFEMCQEVCGGGRPVRSGRSIGRSIGRLFLARTIKILAVRQALFMGLGAQGICAVDKSNRLFNLLCKQCLLIGFGIV